MRPSKGTNNRMNISRLSGIQQQTMQQMEGQSSKHGSQSVEPGFRVYGKNHAAREFNDMVKVKARVRLAQIEDFSFRARTGN